MTAKAAKASPKKTKTTKPKTAVVSKSAATGPKTTEKKIDSKRSLRLWNIRLGAVLLLLAIAVIVFAGSASVHVTTQYLAKDALASEAVGGGNVFAPAIRHLADVHVSWLVAKFLAIFAVVYLLVATLLRKQYETWLDRGVNNLRWVGFGAGGGTAMVLVAMLGGESNLSTLLLIFGLVALAGLLTAAAELLGPGRRLRRLLAVGAIVAVVLPWLGLAWRVVAGLLYDGTLPTYLYFTHGAITLLVVAVGLAAYMRIRQRGRWADGIYAERMFMMLGFLGSTTLALQIFAGALQP